MQIDIRVEVSRGELCDGCDFLDEGIRYCNLLLTWLGRDTIGGGVERCQECMDQEEVTHES